MAELQLLHSEHARGVLEFELANREYFAASITDRGDEFFEDFDQRHAALLAEQEAGTGAYYLLIADDGAIMGRFNLYGVGGGTANLGYRVGKHFAGGGLASAAVVELCGFASSRHGFGRIRAATSHDNRASQRVLLKAGFVVVGPADPSELGGRSGTWYQRDSE